MSAIPPIPATEPGAPALIGVSGGRDSVALLHALAAGGWRLTVCHLDHALRAESADDARFVSELAAGYGFAAVVEREDVAGLAAQTKQSIETAAREARYAFFARTMRECGARPLFLAHHAEDQVETFLFRLFRGSGPVGLEAMRAEFTRECDGVTVRIVRPFLAVWRAEIDAYVDEHGLAFREDPSNADPRHMRNRLRHEVLPALEAGFGRDVRRAVWRAAEILRAENEVIAGHPALRETMPAELSAAEVRALPLALQRRLLHRWLRQQDVPAIGFAEIEAVRGLLTAVQPAKVNLAAGWHARRRAGRLFLEPDEA